MPPRKIHSASTVASVQAAGSTCNRIKILDDNITEFSLHDEGNLDMFDGDTDLHPCTMDADSNTTGYLQTNINIAFTRPPTNQHARTTPTANHNNIFTHVKTTEPDQLAQ